MIIPDTSVWIDLFRGIDNLLASPPVVTQRRLLHPFVFGELLLGGLPADKRLRDVIDSLVAAPVAQPSEVAAFIQWAHLSGTGIGYVDVHLLVSAKMIGALVLTNDQSLHAQAERLGVAYLP